LLRLGRALVEQYCGSFRAVPQLDPASRGLHFHRLERAKDPNFWSVRVNAEIRIIVHRAATSLLLCYVGNHDAAYAWAERRRIDRHPVTGAAQLVELPERLDDLSEIQTRQPTATVTPKPLFSDVPGGALLAYGVPFEWLDAVRQVTTEDGLLDLINHLPQEAAEALLNLATGDMPEIPALPAASVEAGRTMARSYSYTPLPSAPGPWTFNRSSSDFAGMIDPTAGLAASFSHPDAQRRFRVLTNAEELERALDFPSEKWAVFLHPAQRQLIERDYTGPARVPGSAGTGKTVVALHRAVALARRHSGPVSASNWSSR
jgi:hypothetical protein